jgi:hypothetical protein
MKVFRLEEAAALLPTIRPLVDEMLQARRDLAIDLLEADAAQRMPAEQPTAGRTRLIEERARDHQMRIVELVEKIHSYGCIVKDVDLGLVDFPALRGGQLVNLCWKKDEPSIAFWHGVEEGFSARRPLKRGI